MTPEEILERATVEGVIVTLSSTDTIRVTGDQAAVDRWLPAIRDHKPSILTELQREQRRAKVLALLESAPDTRYAVHVADASMDPVVITVGICKIAVFELEIPLQYYDGTALLDLMEKQSVENVDSRGSF